MSWQFVTLMSWLSQVSHCPSESSMIEIASNPSLFQELGFPIWSYIYLLAFNFLHFTSISYQPPNISLIKKLSLRHISCASLWIDSILPLMLHFNSNSSRDRHYKCIWLVNYKRQQMADINNLKVLECGDSASIVEIIIIIAITIINLFNWPWWLVESASINW